MVIQKGMDNLQEAYLSVYSPQENIEEGLRSAVKRLLGGGKKQAEAPKPQSRGEVLRQRYNVGPEGSDTSAKRRILDRAKDNAERAQNQVNMGNASQSYANNAKGAHNKYLKAGYSKYGADLPVSGGQGGSGGAGGGHKARKREAALNKEQFDWIVDTLLDEGYDLSTYTVDEFYNICLEEVEQLDEGRTTSLSALSRESQKRKEDKERGRPETEAEIHGRLMLGKFRPGASQEERAEGGRQRLKDRGKVPQRGCKDMFEQVLEYLVAEGYADTNENAIAIMANMSEEWREEILDEAVRGSERSIANRITGNDIRSVNRGNKPVYKKPKWKDGVENEVSRSQSTVRTQTSNTYDGGRDSDTIEANKKSIRRLNAAKNIEDKQADGNHENSIDHSNPSKGKSGYMEVPTDHRARRRRASGR